MHAFEIRAHVIQERKAEHRAVRARDEECFCRRSRCHGARSRLSRGAISSRLRRLHDLSLRIKARLLHRLLEILVVGVAGRARQALARMHIEKIGRKDLRERHAVLDHADDERRVIVERHEHGLVAIRPRCSEVLYGGRIEIRIVHGSVRGRDRVRRAATQIGFHLRQNELARRHACESVVNTKRLLARPGKRRRCCCNYERNA